MTSPSASASPSVTPATAAQLKRLTLQGTDLPAGWKGAPQSSDSTDKQLTAKLVSCVGGRNTDSDKVADVNSEEFTLADASISSSASSYKSRSDLDSDIALIHNPKLDGCYRQLISSLIGPTLPQGAKVVSVDVKTVPGSNGGPPNVAGTTTASIQVSANGQQIPLYQTVTYLTGPLLEAEVDASNAGAPPPAAAVRAAIKAVAARVARG